jgi:hypothetical protein
MGIGAQAMKLIIHLCPVPRLRAHGVINPLPILLHDVTVKYEDNVVFLYFMVYLTMPFRVQTTCRRMVGGVRNDELERLWKELVVA